MPKIYSVESLFHAAMAVLPSLAVALLVEYSIGVTWAAITFGSLLFILTWLWLNYTAHRDEKGNLVE